MDSTIKIAVVYHSGFGHTKKQAEAVRDGAAEVRGVHALLMDVTEAQQRWIDLEVCEAIIFGAPTYMGSASAEFKAFQEATSRPVLAKGFAWSGKLAAGFTNSGARSGGKLSTLVQLSLFAAQHGMHWINLGLPPANNSSQGSDEERNRLGIWLGAGAQSNVDQGPDLAPPRSDLDTARFLGRRVAETASQLARGRSISERAGSRHDIR
jgi:NAD(P)H dehydrogenase (quinone)